MLEVVEVPELLVEESEISLPPPPPIQDLVPETIRRQETNRNVMAIVSRGADESLSSLTIPIFSSPDDCGDPRAVIGVGKASQLSGGEVRGLLREVRNLEAIDWRNPDSPIAPESMKGLFAKLLKMPNGLLDLGVYPDRAAKEYELRLMPEKFGIVILKEKIIEKDLSDGRKLISIPARFPSSRLDMVEFLEFTKGHLPTTDVPSIFHVPVLQPTVTKTQVLDQVDVYFLLGDRNIVILHDADRVADSLQYGHDPIHEIISATMRGKLKESDPLSVMVEVLRDIDRVHSQTLDMLDSRLEEVSLNQRQNDGFLKGTKTLDELNRLTISLNTAQREILHLRRTSSSMLSACSTEDFAEKYGSTATLARNRSHLSGITDRLAKDQERVNGMQQEIESMHRTHSARESIASQAARHGGALFALWATPMMGAHYASSLALEHGLKIAGPLAGASIAVSAITTLWLYLRNKSK